MGVAAAPKFRMKFLALFLVALATLSFLYAAALRIVDPRGDFGTAAFPVVELDARTEKMQLAITADQGVVTLAGIVDRSSEPVHASEVVAALPRVKEIKNELRIATASRVKLDS